MTRLELSAAVKAEHDRCFERALVWSRASLRVINHATAHAQALRIAAEYTHRAQAMLDVLSAIQGDASRLGGH